jgi:hypothetical protein
MADEEKPKRVYVLHECSQHKIVEDGEGNVGVLNAMEDGVPIPDTSTIVRCTPVEDEPGVNELTVLRRGAGPAKVSSKNYRNGWDSIFGSKAEKRPRKEDMN